MAEEVGEEYGRALAAPHGAAATGQRSFRAALHAVADALTAHGFAAHAEQRGDELRIVNEHCPFGDAAIEHPVICAVDRGMVRGMLAALYGDTGRRRERRCPRRRRLRHRRSEPGAAVARGTTSITRRRRRCGPAAPRRHARWLRVGAGDPGRVHTEGRMARVAVEEAREQVAALLGARPREVVFTSGAHRGDRRRRAGARSSGRGDHVVVPGGRALGGA